MQSTWNLAPQELLSATLALQDLPSIIWLSWFGPIDLGYLVPPVVRDDMDGKSSDAKIIGRSWKVRFAASHAPWPKYTCKMLATEGKETCRGSTVTLNDFLGQRENALSCRCEDVQRCNMKSVPSKLPVVQLSALEHCGTCSLRSLKYLPPAPPRRRRVGPKANSSSKAPGASWAAGLICQAMSWMAWKCSIYVSYVYLWVLFCSVYTLVWLLIVHSSVGGGYGSGRWAL